VRCPAGIKITDLMYELKRLAIKYDLWPRGTKNPAMTKYFIDSVQKHGRNHEVELIGKFVLLKDPMLAFQFAGVGIKLFLAGRMPLFAKNIKGRDEITRIAQFVDGKEVAVP
jgi:heterodisulfide reductase subunit C